jgi:hypothetical protein
MRASVLEEGVARIEPWVDAGGVADAVVFQVRFQRVRHAQVEAEAIRDQVGKAEEQVHVGVGHAPSAGVFLSDRDGTRGLDPVEVGVELGIDPRERREVAAAKAHVAVAADKWHDGELRLALLGLCARLCARLCGVWPGLIGAAGKSRRQRNGQQYRAGQGRTLGPVAEGERRFEKRQAHPLKHERGQSGDASGRREGAAPRSESNASALVGETRSPRRVSPNVEEGPRY